MATQIVPGLSRDDLLKEIDKLIPPVRPEGLGVTLSEIAKHQGIGRRTAKRALQKTNLVAVDMLAGRNVTAIYMTPEQAEPYKDWIVE